MGDSIEVVCIGCGKKIQASFPKEQPAGEQHNAVVKCECGAVMHLVGTGGSGTHDTLKILNELSTKIPAVLKSFQDSRRKGFDTGMDQALHDIVQELTVEVLKDDESLRERIKEIVKNSLEQSFPEGQEFA